MNKFCEITIKRIFFVLIVFVQIISYVFSNKLPFVSKHKDFIFNVILPILGVVDAYFCEMIFVQNLHGMHRINQEENIRLLNNPENNRPQRNLRRINSNDNLLISSKEKGRSLINNLFKKYQG